jgi:hypothetical protein
VPSPNIASIFPLTEQTAVGLAANWTVNPEEAVAFSAKGATPKRCGLTVGNVIVCVACAIRKLCVTDAAAY